MNSQDELYSQRDACRSKLADIAEHAEKLELARERVGHAMFLFCDASERLKNDIAELIDAKIELALLERGGK